MEQALQGKRLIYSVWDFSEMHTFTSQSPCLFSGSVSMLWKCIVDRQLKVLSQACFLCLRMKKNRETGKYVIFLDKAKAARKEVLDFKSLDTWSWTKQICMCKRYLKEIWLLIANFLFLCYQCTFQLEITRS